VIRVILSISSLWVKEVRVVEAKLVNVMSIVSTLAIGLISTAAELVSNTDVMKIDPY
jgi:hypothetical protein